MYMQRILFILTAAVLSLLAGEAYAQRDLPGQTGIQFTTGGVNHFLLWKSGGERHYFTSLAFTHTNRNRTYWLYGLDYQIKEYTYENKAIPKAQFAWDCVIKLIYLIITLLYRFITAWYHNSIFFILLICSSYFQVSSIILPFPEHSHLTLSIGNASEIRDIISLPIVPLPFPLLSELLIYPFPILQYTSKELYPFTIFSSYLA